MSVSPFARFFDILNQNVELDARMLLKSLLVIGPGENDPLDSLLAWAPAASLTAIDIEARVAAVLRANYGFHPRLRIVHADAAHLSSCAPGPYNLICVRHPNIDEYPHQWRLALDAAIANLALGCLLVITTYSLPEGSALQQMLSQQPRVVMAANRRSLVPVDLRGNDRYALVYRRAESESETV